MHPLTILLAIVGGIVGAVVVSAILYAVMALFLSFGCLIQNTGDKIGSVFGFWWEILFLGLGWLIPAIGGIVAVVYGHWWGYVPLVAGIEWLVCAYTIWPEYHLSRNPNHSSRE